MADFLLELLCEEIPARMQAKARNDLARLFAEHMSDAGLQSGAITVLSTPRRLALAVNDLAESTDATHEEIRGPRVGSPDKAIEGFLKKNGLSRDQLQERDGVFFGVIERSAKSAAQILAERIPLIVWQFPWPKSMRWGDPSRSPASLRWVRPLHGLVAILGGEVLSFSLDVAMLWDNSEGQSAVTRAMTGISAGATTLGHRFHHAGPITIGGAKDYLEKLRACHVIVDQEERERLIRDGAEAVAVRAGLTLLDDEGLVVENAGLTEWPVPLLGRFDPEFLDVPREVIVQTMRTNQKYFACLDQDANLAPAFVCVANVSASDGGVAIAEGNRRVLAARLADARFFWEQDLKKPLSEFVPELARVVFHEKLGSMLDKAGRIAGIASFLAEAFGRTYEAGHRAGYLCKADLLTGLVGEFPELQGVIGGYYAERTETAEVARAIRDHYRPAGPEDAVPEDPLTVAVSLADKLDTLVGFFIVGEQPTGSKDPYALRRAALGVVAMILQNNIRLGFQEFAINQVAMLHVQNLLTRTQESAPELKKLVQTFRVSDTRVDFHKFLEKFEETVEAAGFANSQSLSSNLKTRIDLLRHISRTLPNGIVELSRFIVERLKVQQRQAGVRHDIVDAVFAISAEDDIVRLLTRVKALQTFVEKEEGADLLTAYKRAANILKKENWVGPQVLSSPAEQGIPQTGEEDPLVLVEEPGLKEAVAEIASGQAGADLPEEKALIAALDNAEPKASAAVEAEDFTGAMAALASLRRPIDDFFDHVTVNDPDATKRERRLNLLMRFRDAVNRVADFSKIEG